MFHSLSPRSSKFVSVAESLNPMLVIADRSLVIAERSPVIADRSLVILSAAKNLGLHAETRPFASLRVTGIAIRNATYLLHAAAECAVQAPGP
jgi:hypothetical protein